MRELKFRAFSPYWKPAFIDGKAEPAMEYFRLSDLSGGYTPNYDIGIDEVDVELMQYTGLKDKNGKDIYEGDVVNLIPDGYSLEKAEVCWNTEIGGGWIYRRISTLELINGQAVYPKWGAVETIGNIYENPELIKAEVS